MLTHTPSQKTVYSSSGAGIGLFIGFNRREFLLFKQREYWGWETDPSTFSPFNRCQERCWSFSSERTDRIRTLPSPYRCIILSFLSVEKQKQYLKNISYISYLDTELCLNVFSYNGSEIMFNFPPTFNQRDVQ